MAEHDCDETRQFWNSVARDWDTQVAEDGDANRILNSDPVLWHFLGDVSGLDVLDAGCGTGYLSRKLRERGASVVGVDFSERMIGIARAKSPEIDYHVDSCSELKSVPDESMDRVVSNYVLMDVPDLEETVRAFHRVLKVGGVVVLVFSHPCFPQGGATASETDFGVRYDWKFSYFEPQKRIDPPWNHFKSEFIWFHRPLSDYWKMFKSAGFEILEFEEPHVRADRYHLAPDTPTLQSNRQRPCSVAFKLRKNGSA